MDVDFQGLKYATACFNVWRTVINKPYQDNIKRPRSALKHPTLASYLGLILPKDNVPRQILVPSECWIWLVLRCLKGPGFGQLSSTVWSFPSPPNASSISPAWSFSFLSKPDHINWFCSHILKIIMLWRNHEEHPSYPEVIINVNRRVHSNTQRSTTASSWATCHCCAAMQSSIKIPVSSSVRWKL